MSYLIHEVLHNLPTLPKDGGFLYLFFFVRSFISFYTYLTKFLQNIFSCHRVVVSVIRPTSSSVTSLGTFVAVFVYTSTRRKSVTSRRVLIRTSWSRESDTLKIQWINRVVTEEETTLIPGPMLFVYNTTLKLRSDLNGQVTNTNVHHSRGEDYTNSLTPGSEVQLVLTTGIPNPILRRFRESSFGQMKRTYGRRFFSSQNSFYQEVRVESSD